ncbi:helix-turn-helix domain-containing protein [Gallibacterium sp. AGMB14963]|uniref:helix-turn-helix domain-containing protein n=1 Tax=Gallibacterium faecale TaxID=3019086 RepID=UPI0022F1AF41|nr:helix-turn-helix transcriptional regulator [Gallibacterium sp. AGMB14963]MDA3979837.1 helix-turn-helix transcriptional regulator [Gallibacterium sp. AGMB14963]
MVSKNNSDIAKSIGKAIAKYRKAANLSQSQLAEIIGVSNDAISRMERGTIVLNVIRLFEFAEIFGCNVADLLVKNSERLEDQEYRLAKKLAQLNKEDRDKLLDIIENILQWKQQ